MSLGATSMRKSETPLSMPIILRMLISYIINQREAKEDTAESERNNKFNMLVIMNVPLIRWRWALFLFWLGSFKYSSFPVIGRLDQNKPVELINVLDTQVVIRSVLNPYIATFMCFHDCTTHRYLLPSSNKFLGSHLKSSYKYGEVEVDKIIDNLLRVHDFLFS